MNNSRRRPSALTTAASMLLGLVLAATAHAGSFTLNVVDQDGNPVEGFRWLVQQDATFDHQPGESIPNAAEPDNYPFSLSFHRSYHPLARTEIGGTGLSGNTDLDTVTIDDVADGRYYVSVLPYADHSISGQPVRVEAGAGGDVTVVVQRQPIPTAQIAIYLFLDNAPVNGVPDLPEETNPAAGEPGHVDWSEFSLFLEEPAGRYGMAGGQVIQDAFGNPLGTTYLKGCDENGQADADPTSNYGCFDADGAPIVVTPGDGTLHPNPNGTMLVENLAPGKYGVIMIPPTGQNWQQTSTIEGTKVIDAWVKANEPPFFVEFGLPGPHVFIGYIKSSANGGFPPMQPPAFGQDTATISGTVTDMHMSRPPAFEFFSGRPFPGCWVALNDMTVGVGRGVWAGPCDADSNFEIPDVPPGNYQLKVFDDNLDVVIATLPVSVDANNGTCNNDPDAASCALGEVPVFNWFARLSTGVFSDLDQDGFWDDGEPGIGPESQDVSLRWRDGTMYQNFPTDGEGMAPFDEMFPFFHWLVAEVSFANKKATGATFVVDAGGPVDKSTDAFPSYGELNPQHQCVDDGSGATVGHQPDGTCPPGAEAINPHTLDDLSRTEVGQVLTQGVQGFLGQTNVMHFGKAEYLSFTPFVPPTPTTPPIPGAWVGENGGISGIVYYAVTRAEDEPQFAAAEEWEPGIPNVQLAMYADGDIDSFPLGDWPSGPGDIDWDGDGVLDGDDGMIDDANLNGIPGELADVDNFPFGNFPGPEDVDRDDNGGTPGVFDLGDALQVAVTDSWDASLPTGCQGEDYVYQQKELIGGEIVVTSEHPTDCYDGLRNFNQIRPAVFDGGFAFADYDLDNINPNVAADIQAYYDYVAGLQASGRISQASYDALQLGLLPGQYIIEAAAPPGYEHIKEEDRNVDFGDNYIPSAQALAVPCVGDDHLVPPYFSMSTRDGSGGELQLIPGIDPAEAAAPYANIMRPLCDRKEVQLSSAQNAGVEFFLMTDVPIVANVAGMILNDMASEFDPNAPTFGEKAAPPWVPVGFYDFDGKQVNRVYADQYGRYNAVLPSTYTTNLPQPSGMSPNMLIACMNDAGPIEEIDPATGEPTGKLIIDPYFDQRFSQFCYTFQYMPGVITYLDTPVLPIAAFAGPGNAPLDCERPAATPVIASVTRSTLDGPYVNGTVQSTILIDSMGMQEVPNPEWNGISFGDRVIWRDYGFGGADGTVQLRNRDNNVVANLAHTWGNDQISATVPAGTPAGQYQVVVTSADGTESPIGATLTVGPGRYAVRRVSEGQSIQAAIDLAAPGDLILVGPGVYDELVIMWKPVALQGWGAGVVSINARQAPTEKVANWRNKASTLVAQGAISQLTGQQVGVPAFPALDEVVFPTEEGAGIFVAGRRPQGTGCGNPNNSAFRCMLARHDARPRIDGITIVGASTGGGIVVNGYNEDLEIGNMRLNANAGFYGGGIRIGHPTVSHVVTQGNDPDGQVGDIVYDDANNDNVRIHHNHVAQNGGFGGAGGGVSLHTGTDNYRVENNWICGNYSQGDGGGIGHLGRSRGGRIVGNDIIFNESFDQMLSTSGGGIFVGGQAPLMPASNTGRLVTPGSGNVDIDANNIRGNLAGGGQGGGVRIASVNGAELDTNTSGASAVANWYRVRLFNNMITNNVAGLAGGGVSLQDAVRTVIRNNTIANNDSTATAGLAFPAGNPNASVAQPAGVASNVHSAEFALLMANDVNPNVYAGPRDAATWPVYTDPVIRDSVVLHNRSFYWVNDPAQCPAPGYCLLPDPATPAYADFAIMNGILPADTGLAGDLATLQPLYSLLTDAAAFPAGWNNISGAAGNSDFANGYFNAGRGQTIVFAEGTTLQTAGAFDEGGNWLQVGFSPLSLLEPGANADPALNTTQFDYHLAPGSAAIGAATPSGHTGLLSVDIDREPRVDPGSDIGADEAQ